MAEEGGEEGGEGTDHLSLLPGEVLLLVLVRLDAAALARVEAASPALRAAVQEGGLWHRLAVASNAREPYPFVTGMLQYCAMRQLADPVAAKITLVARRLLEQSVEAYMAETKVEELLPCPEVEVDDHIVHLPPHLQPHLQPHHLQPVVQFPHLQFQRRTGIAQILRDKSVQQLKALSRKHLMVEETEYPVMSEHRALFHRLFNPRDMDVHRGIVQVAALIEKLSFSKQQQEHKSAAYHQKGMTW